MSQFNRGLPFCSGPRQNFTLEEIESENESVEGKAPVRDRIRSLTPEKVPAVNSTISLVDDPKRLGKRPINPSKPSCKDFNGNESMEFQSSVCDLWLFLPERGYCMRGQFCPFDHGTDPMIWQNASPMEVIRYNTPRVPAIPQPVRLPGFPPITPLVPISTSENADRDPTLIYLLALCYVKLKRVAELLRLTPEPAVSRPNRRARYWRSCRKSALTDFTLISKLYHLMLR